MVPIRPRVCVIAGLAIWTIAWGVSRDTAASEPPPDRINQGRELFFREWMPGDPRSHGGDGLGPLYNATSCVACHNLGAPGGAGPASKNVDIVTLVRRLAPADENRLDEYHPGFRTSPSVLLHRFGTDPEYNYWRVRRVGGVELADMAEQGGAAELEQVRELMGLKADSKPNKTFSRFRPPPRGAARVKGDVHLASIATLTQRNPPPLFGAGLIDSIPAEALREAVCARGPRDSRPAEHLEGRPHRPLRVEGEPPPSKISSNRPAPTELGLEVPTRHQAKRPLDFSKKETGLDLTQGECDALTAFVAGLPRRSNAAHWRREGKNAPISRPASHCSRGSVVRHVTFPSSDRWWGSTAICSCTTWGTTSSTRVATMG